MGKEESYELLGAYLSNGRQGQTRRRHDLRGISSLRAGWGPPSISSIENFLKQAWIFRQKDFALWQCVTRETFVQSIESILLSPLHRIMALLQTHH